MPPNLLERVAAAAAVLLSLLTAVPLAAASFSSVVSSVGNGASKITAISIVAQMDGDLARVVGNVAKHAANPLFVQSTPQESRIDNGYPNIIPPSPDGLLL